VGGDYRANRVAILINSLAVARAVHFAAMMMMEGAIVFRFIVAEPSLRGLAAAPIRFRLLHRYLAWASWLGLVVGFVSGVVWLVLLAANIGQIAPAQALSRGIVWVVFTRTQFGATWLMRAVLAVVLAASLAAFDRTAIYFPRSSRATQIVLAAALVGSLAWAGHGAATVGPIGNVQLIGDVLHLVVSGVWVGGLLPLAVMLTIASRLGEGAGIEFAVDAVRRFSILGIVCVLTLLLTGLVNTYVLAASIPALVGTSYGRLLLVKIGLFVTMVAIAAVNRQYLTPRIGSASTIEAPTIRRTLTSLVRNSVTEFVLGVLTLGIVGILGTLIPGSHDQPVWPLPIRFSGDAFDDPDIRIHVLVAIGAITVAALAALAAIWGRRLRWPLVIGAILIVGYFAPALGNLTERAYPTSFYSSPTGFTAKSVAAGHRSFLENCAVCHGSQGRGDGPASQSLATKPADLTAEHIYAHPDGDLFWWITHGKSGVMPAFGDVLDEKARWNLIDFIHANADAVQLRTAAGRVTGVGFPLPNFSVECPDGSVRSASRLKGRVLHLILATPQTVDRLRVLERFEPPDVIRIIVGPTESPFACMTADSQLSQVLALYRGEQNQGISFAESLVDKAGALRAVWEPGSGEDWRDPKVLLGRINNMRRIPAAVRSAGGHEHHH
jgi:putative copper export protein/mono/diheme cytochrome c family protein